jgi:hypothetical protein
VRNVLACLCLVTLASCSSSPNNPTPTPTPTPTAPTRIISVTGNLNFGEVTVGQSADRQLSISNTGNATLTVTGITGPCGGSFTSTFVSGTIAAGGTQNATIRFTPVSAGSCSGTVTVVADQTSGTNTIAITATAVSAVRTMTGTWTGSWSTYTFTMVLTQTGTVVTGTYTDRDGLGRTDPAQPGTFFDPNVVLRIKQAAFSDFTLDGVMSSNGRTVTGTARAAGGNFPLSMTKQ